MGISNSITGSAVSYAGGGGGGAARDIAVGAASPCGTGGTGGTCTPSTTAGPGTINTGGGGGGTNTGCAGLGGSGIVIIRSPADSCISVTGGCNTVSIVGGEQVARFVSSGNYVIGK